MTGTIFPRALQNRTSMKMKIIIALGLCFSLVACKKDNASSTLKIRMTDAPLAVDEVNIDLQRVEVKFEKDTSKWTTMQANAGIYNLLGLQNGLDTLIAQGTYPTGVVKEIRLITGIN